MTRSALALALLALALLAGCATTDHSRTLARFAQLEDHRVGAGEIASHLSSENAGVRGAATLALGRIEDPASLGPVTRVLEDGDHRVRRIAAFSLGQLGDPGAEAPLLARLRVEAHPAVMVELWRALGRIGGEAAIAAARSSRDEMRPTAIVAAGIVAKRLGIAIDWLEGAGGGEDPEVRAAVLYAASRAKVVPEWAPGLAGRSLSSPSASERDAAVRVLGRGAGSGAAPAAQALGSPALSAHQRAVLVAGLKGVDSAAKAVHGAGLAALQRPLSAEIHVALAAAKVVGEPLAIQAQEALNAARVVAGPAPSKALVRRLEAAICAGGGRCPEPTKAEALERLEKPTPADLARALADPDRPLNAVAADRAAKDGVRAAAVLEALNGAWERAFEARDYEVAQSVLKALARLGPGASTASLLQASGSTNLALSRLARKILAERKVPVSAPARLIPLFDDAAFERYRVPPGPLRIAIHTEVGAIDLEMLVGWAPRTVQSFARLAREGFFDGLTFHRVVRHFVIQGGDPRGDGWGGPGFTLRCENNPVPYTSGTVGMALAGKDTGGSQWFVTHSAQPHLMGRYTVFAKVAKGMEVVDRIIPGDRIERVEIR